MKTWKQNVLIGLVAIIAFGFAFVACDDGNGDDPKDQSQTIELFEGNTAIVKGNLTDTEWNGVPDKIKNAINGAFTNGEFLTQAYLRGICDDGFTIIVEKTSEYNKYKVADGEFRKLYINYSYLKSATDNDLQKIITSAVAAMGADEPKTE